MYRKVLWKSLQHLRHLAEKYRPLPIQPDIKDCQTAYAWLNPMFSRMLKANRLLKPYAHYTWGMQHAAYLAYNLGVKRISAIEFGVAGGNGLVALERSAELMEQQFSIEIAVFGFDSGKGLPKPQDYRDVPNLFSEGDFVMDEDRLRNRLTRAHLSIGLISETLPDFLNTIPPPVGFISIDVDMYKSAKHALNILESKTDILMPRIYCYFDDILSYTYADHNGERLAIREFNKLRADRQISQIYGLRFYVPREGRNRMWSEKMFMAHIIDHELYNEYDGHILKRGKRNLELLST